jgi:putative ABC transport system permease protein
MLKNYLMITLRNIKKHKGYSFINIAGLAIGMACCILIFLYVWDELSFDRYHEHADRIYRLERKGRFNGQDYHEAVSPNPMGPALANDFPEILQAVRFVPRGMLVRDQKNTYSPEAFFFTDANVFDVFSFSLVKGNPNTALVEPNSIILTETMARRYLADGEPLGQILTLNVGDKLVELLVTGILQEMLHNSHFRAQFLVSFSTLKALWGNELANSWFENGAHTYLLVQDGIEPLSLSEKFPAFLEKYMGARVRQLMGADFDLNEVLQLQLLPLTDIYLYSDVRSIGPVGNITNVYIFSAIAVFILIIAGINFVNLATARSAGRAREVGLRKVIGASRGSLIRQFLGESLIVSLFALGLAIVVVELILPDFNGFTAKNLALGYHEHPWMMLLLLLIAVCVGIGAGIYPAFFLSAFRPADVLKGSQRSGSGGRSSGLRKGLIVFQFALSTIFIIATIVVTTQMNYIKHKQLGFQKEQIVVISPSDVSLGEKIESLKSELLQQVNVLGVSLSSDTLQQEGYSSTPFYKEGSSPEESVTASYFAIDEAFISTLKISIAAGRNFSTDFATDQSAGYLLNESAVSELGWPSPEAAIGNTLFGFDSDVQDYRALGSVIGVVKDFHFMSLHQKIEPLVMRMDSNHFNHFLIRVSADDIPGTLASIEQTFKQFSPNYPFAYHFLDEQFDHMYRKEQQMQQIFGYCTMLAIFVACLGLFGLASFMTEQRTKEIGIRKTLGASVASIVLLLSKEFTKWVVLANLFAWPIAYFMMNRWLQGFAYRTEIHLWVFVAAACSTFAIALLTVSWQSIKAALANPVKALRYE